MWLALRILDNDDNDIWLIWHSLFPFPAAPFWIVLSFEGVELSHCAILKAVWNGHCLLQMISRHHGTICWCLGRRRPGSLFAVSSYSRSYSSSSSHPFFFLPSWTDSPAILILVALPGSWQHWQAVLFVEHFNREREAAGESPIAFADISQTVTRMPQSTVESQVPPMSQCLTISCRRFCWFSYSLSLFCNFRNS